MDYYNITGVSITFIDNYEISWTKTYGTKSDKEYPVTDTTLFQAASMSKPITATILLHYIEEGKIELDATVNEYLTGWKLP
jgi:CubicO group peptidase (beta-lactamase class C family)